MSNYRNFANMGRFILGTAAAVLPPAGDTTAPTITSSNSVSVNENATLSHSLTADETVTWSLVGGADQAQFEISGSTLRWSSNGTRDYEVPADADADNAYVVTVRATDTSSNTTDQTITVTVQDAADQVYPLANAGTLPIAAYGITKLNSAYAGNCCRIVRASDSSTLAVGWITATLDNGVSAEVWDYPSINTFLTGTTGKIDILYDQSGNSNNMTQTTDASRPRYDGVRLINGIPSIDFVGTWMTIPAGVTVNRQSFDTYTVWEQHNSNLSGAVSHLGDNSTYATFYINADASSFAKGYVGGSGGSFAIRVDPCIYKCQGTASHLTLTQGTDDTNVAAAGSSTTLTGGYLGKIFTGGWEANARLMSHVIYARNLSGGEETSLRSGLASHFACVETVTHRLLFQGDSIGAGSARNYDGWGHQGDYGAGVARYNNSQGGATVQTLASTVEAKLGDIIDTHSGDEWIVFLHIGTNDLTINARTAAQIEGDITTVANNVKVTHSKKVIVSTLLPNGGWNGTQQTTWGTLTTNLEANYASYANSIVKFSNSASHGNSNMGDFADAGDSTKYPDGLHPSEVIGYGYLTPDVETAVNALW